MPHILQCGPHRLMLGGKTLIMGILNVTPDSFSDGGLYQDVDSAVAAARAFVGQGADLIDVGAESTRPNHQPISEEEELERLLPVLRGLSRADLGVPISVDTRKATVALEAAKAGAHMINDTDGLQGDPHMAEAVAATGLPVVIMHNRPRPDYPEGVMADLFRYFNESLKRAKAAGIPEQRILLDPGFGFGKEPEHNLELTERLAELRQLGYPLLYGPSRKSTIGRVLNLPVTERVEGTAALVAMAVDRGVEVVRVHDVQTMVRVARMVEAVRDFRKPGGPPHGAVVPGVGASSTLSAADAARSGQDRWKIALEGMEFYGYHGVHEEERRLGQRFRLDVEVGVTHLQMDDDLGATLDYASIYEATRRVVEGEPVRLLETLAENVCRAIAEIKPVQSIRVRIEKPAAPVPGIFAQAIVERTWTAPFWDKEREGRD